MNHATATADSLVTSVPRTQGRRCAAQHFGVWSIEPKFFQSAMNAIRQGTWKPELASKKRRKKAKAPASPKAGGVIPAEDDCPRDEWGDPIYVVKDGVAVITIDGAMTKHGSSFGGCSTIRVRHALRLAYDDYRVKAAVLHADDCPGGTCAGTADLAQDVLAFRHGRNGKRGKRLLGYASDMLCSAGYWVLSQCESIHCNATAIVGSIGTYTVLTDDTTAQERWGVKSFVVSTGPYKGLGADGKVTPELVADVQREVDELNAVFLAGVRSGRGAKIPDLAKVADGRAWVGEQAVALGLVDGICSLDEALVLAAAPPPKPADKPAPPAPDPNQTKQQAGADAGNTPKSAGTGGERNPMDPKKKDYLVSIGLKADATDEEAQTFYDLLSPEKQAEADAAVTDESTETEQPADETQAAATGKPADGKKADGTTGPAPTTTAAALPDLIAACDGDKAVAADYFVAGMSVDQAKAAYAGVKAARAETATKQQELEREKFQASGRKPVGTGGPSKPAAKAGDFEQIADPKERAKAEFAADLDGCKSQFSNEAAYVGFRVADLRGQIKSKGGGRR